MKIPNQSRSVTEAYVIEISGVYYRELLHLVDVYQFGDYCGLPHVMEMVDQDVWGVPVSTCGVPAWRPVIASRLEKAKELAQQQLDEALGAYQIRCARTAILDLAESNYAITEAIDSLRNKARGFDEILANVQSVGFDTSGSTHDDCVQLVSTLATSGVDALFHEKLKVMDKHIEELKAKFESLSSFFKLQTSDIRKNAENVIGSASEASRLASMFTSEGLKDLEWHIRSTVRAMERETANEKEKLHVGKTLDAYGEDDSIWIEERKRRMGIDIDED